MKRSFSLVLAVTISLTTVCWAAVALGGPADLSVNILVNPAYQAMGGTTSYLDGSVTNSAGSGCTDIVITAIPMNSLNEPLASPVTFPLALHVLDGAHSEYFHQAVVQPIGTNHWNATVSGSATSYAWIGILPAWIKSAGPFNRRLYSFNFPTYASSIAGLIGVGHEEENDVAPDASGVYLDGVTDASQANRVIGPSQSTPLQLEGSRPWSMTYQNVHATATWVDYTPQPVYRFFNRLNGSHFYTSSEAEKEHVRTTMTSTYTFEGVAHQRNTTNPTNMRPLYRFFNRTNGSHFYTTSEAEKERVRTTMTSTYSFDGVAYQVSTFRWFTKPVYRFYNRLNGSHFYTTDEAEKERVRTTMTSTYTFEGIAYYLGY